MIHGSLFSGIGGFDLAAQWAGIETTWQVENDPFCQMVLKRHFPDAKQFGDIKTIKNGDLESVEIISGGFPCQPFSCAGKRRGAADDRFLWPEMLRIISDVRPAWVIAENVPGIVNMELDQVLADLESQGYKTTPFVIPACGLNAPHRRDRIWIVGHTKSPGTAKKCRICEGKTIYSLRNNKKDEYNVADTESYRRDSQTQSEMGREEMGRERGCGFVDCLKDAPDSEGDGIRAGLCTGDQGRERRGRFSDGDKPAIADADEQGPQIREMFGCDIREKQPAAFRNPWHEPWPEVATRLCGVDARVSAELDFIGGLNEYLNDKKSESEIRVIIREVLLKMWEWRELATTSPNLYSRRLCDLVPGLPYKRSHGRWHLGKGIEKDEQLRDLWKRFYAGRQPSSQNLQSELLEYLGQIKCTEKVANRVDRLKALGNAIVPQVAFQFFKMIKEIEEGYGL